MRSRRESFELNPFVVMSDLSVSLILIFLFCLLGQGLISSRAWAMFLLSQRQRKVEEAFGDKFPQATQDGTIGLSSSGSIQRLRFSDRVLFRTGQADLLPGGASLLRGVADVLRGNVHLLDSVQIEGHTDNVPIHNRQFSSNWELSSARATSVVALFQEELGFPGELLCASGYGEYRPCATNETPEGRALNRRIDMILVYRDPTKELTRERAVAR